MNEQLKKENGYLKEALAAAYFLEVLRESCLVEPETDLVMDVLNSRLVEYKNASLDENYDYSSESLREVFAKVVEKLERKIEVRKTKCY